MFLLRSERSSSSYFLHRKNLDSFTSVFEQRSVHLHRHWASTQKKSQCRAKLVGRGAGKRICSSVLIPGPNICIPLNCSWPFSLLINHIGTEECRTAAQCCPCELSSFRRCLIKQLVEREAFSTSVTAVCLFSDKLSMLHRMRFPFLEERYAHERRQKRSISTERHVEVLLVADKTMHEFYKEDLEEYLLSIMNKVQLDLTAKATYRSVRLPAAINKNTNARLNVNQRSQNASNCCFAWFRCFCCKKKTIRERFASVCTIIDNENDAIKCSKLYSETLVVLNICMAPSLR